jgi:prepilin-type N-terminal cleavage/methylation domain-containing protein
MLKNKHLSGFTLVEIIVVLGIIALVAGLGFINFQASNNSSTTFSASRDVLTSDIRLAADKALNEERFQGQRPTGWGVQFIGGYNTYTMFADLDGDRVYDTNEKFKSGKLNQDLKIFPSYGGVLTGSVVFNTGDGKTYFNNNQLPVTPTSHLLLYLLNKNSAVVNTLQITPAGTVSVANKAVVDIAQPNSVAGLIAWYKADALTLNNGDPVSSWTDSSSVLNHATQSGSSRPTFVTNIANYLPVVRFDGSDDYLQLGSTIATVRTLIVVMKWGATMSNYCPIVGDTEVTYGSRFAGDIDSSNKILGPAFSQILNGTAYNNGASVAPGGILKDRANFQIAVFTTTANMRFNTISADRPATLARFTKGDYAEIIVYNTVLSTTDRKAVEAYLSYKYNIPIN